MTANLLTQRDFAALAGISTATVVKMIKSGELLKTESGRVPSSELIKILSKRIQKYREFGTLILAFDKTDEEIEEIKKNFLHSDYAKKVKDTLAFYKGMEDIVGTVNKPCHKGSVEVELLQEKYNREILVTFMTKYKFIVDTYFTGLAHTGRFKEFNKINVAAAISYLMYGVVPADFIDDAVQAFLDKQSEASVITTEMNSKFDALMRELSLVGDNNQPIFKRTALTPEFFTKSGEVYRSFFFDTQGNRSVLYLKHVAKTADNLAKYANGKHIKSVIDTTLRDGFCSVVSFDSIDESVLCQCTEEMTNDFYSRIIVANSRESLLKSSNMYAVALVTLLNTSNKVIFDELKG